MGIQTSRAYRPILTFSVLSSLFGLSMFYRGSMAVIAPNLVAELTLTAQALGLLGGAYFYCFSLLQIPMGPLLDRVGPRIVVPLFALIGASGAFLFAGGLSFGAVFVGRILIGIGMAAMLMGPLKVYTLRYPPNQFATLMGLTIAVGTIGNVLAASPLAYAASVVGWRSSIAAAAVITISLAVLLFFLLGTTGARKEAAPIPAACDPQPILGVFQAFRLVLASASFWQMAIASFFRYGTFVSIQALWLGVYLIDVKTYSPVQAGGVLIALSAGYAIGNPAAGRLSDRSAYSRKSITLTGISLYGLMLLPFGGMFSVDHFLWFTTIAFLIGFFNASGNIMYAHLKELFPLNISGTVLALLNFFTIAGGATFTAGMGKVIDLFPHTGSTYPPAAYHAAFLSCVAATFISVICYAFTKKKA